MEHHERSGSSSVPGLRSPDRAHLPEPVVQLACVRIAAAEPHVSVRAYGDHPATGMAGDAKTFWRPPWRSG